MNQLLPTEVQGYIRHVLHMLGMIIVARGGISGDMMEIYVGGLVNLISLAWFMYITFRDRRRKKQEDVGSGSNTL